MKILNLGWGGIHLKAEEGIEEITVDLVEPADVVCDIRKLPFEDDSVDGVYASHVLEHFYSHEIDDVLSEWKRVIKPGGKIILAVPDIIAAMKMALTFGWMTESCPTAGVGNITPHDIFYGYTPEIKTGKEGMAHKTGFDDARLKAHMDKHFTQVTVAKTEGANAQLFAMGIK